MPNEQGSDPQGLTLFGRLPVSRPTSPAGTRLAAGSRSRCREAEAITSGVVAWIARYARILILCLVMAALAAMLHRRGLLDRLELRSLDWRFVERGARRVRDDIVIVAVDDKSIQDLEAGFVYEASGEERH